MVAVKFLDNLGTKLANSIHQRASGKQMVTAKFRNNLGRESHVSKILLNYFKILLQILFQNFSKTVRYNSKICLKMFQFRTYLHILISFD